MKTLAPNLRAGNNDYSDQTDKLGRSLGFLMADGARYGDNEDTALSGA